MDNLRVGDRIGALVESGRLTFYLNGKSLGAACSGLPSDSRSLHFVVDMQGTVDAFRVLPERTTPKTQEELEKGTLLGLVKGDALTRQALVSKLESSSAKAEAGAVDQEGRTALHYLCRDQPDATAEMIALLAQAEPGSCVVQDGAGKTPLLELLEARGSLGAPPKSLLDFGTESEYGAYLTPLCRAGAKLVATKNVSARVRKGTVRHNARLRTTVVWKLVESKAKRVWATGG